MQRFLFCFVFAAFASSGHADTVVAQGTIRSQQIISEDSLSLIEGELSGTFSSLDAVIGLEATVNIYNGQPIRMSDVTTPAIIERNDIVMLHYQNGALSIVTEGRSLERASLGDIIRVQNLASRAAVTGEVIAPGVIAVGRRER